MYSSIQIAQFLDVEIFWPSKFKNSFANKIVNNTFLLGVYPGLTNEMLDFVINTTKEFLEQKWMF